MVILYFDRSYALCYTHYPQLWQSIIMIKDKNKKDICRKK